MSGLAEREHRKEPGEIGVLIGEGQTAQVLRNLCWQLYSKEDKNLWHRLRVLQSRYSGLPRSAGTGRVDEKASEVILLDCPGAIAPH